MPDHFGDDDVDGQLCDVFEATDPVDDAVRDLAMRKHLETLSNLSKSKRRQIARVMGWKV